MSDLNLDAVRARYASATLPRSSWSYASASAGDVPALVAEIERLRANQLPEGGTWTTQRRHRNEPGGPVVGDWLGCQPDEPTEECAANGCEQRRVYHYTSPASPMSVTP